ncbi:hypothetical protein UFOVP105_25 [uncultured Caudovirales phage]|uniref:Uncharacterized protein n=1 Tax=uncultured Caudovirales phage TaxID=2100421 RepID=A0A6J5L1R1_9CAUD|nr:hypothetical protein UFOVP105_25 [uncultured Caudovirales phage]
MSGKKNSCDIERRRKDILKEVSERQSEKTEYVINQIAERLYLRPSTIWNDLKNARESVFTVSSSDN